MVKLTNKGKGKPSKRKNLKTKYKIDRKVKQHKKKLRKEMKKLGQKNIKPRSKFIFIKDSQKDNMLPNSFPFKAQILQHYKDQKPIDVNPQSKPQIPAEWGLVALENRSVYFPKDKDHLTKKYITAADKIWDYANVIVLTVDARDVKICLCPQFQADCHKNGVKVIVVVCKIDTVSEKYLNKAIKQLSSKVYALFTTEPKRKNTLLQEVLQKIHSVKDGQKKVLVVGKANTGKHTLIKQFMKLAKFHNEDYSTINDVQIGNNIFMLDTPYKIADNSEYPLFHVPSTLAQQSHAVQQQKALKYIVEKLQNRNDFIMHYGIQDFNSVDDLLKKIGKVKRVFGKGGMVNVAAVRTTILTDWYQGKLNYILE